MLALGSVCKYRVSFAKRFDCIETIINQLLADSYQNSISEWQVTIKPHVVAGFDQNPTPISVCAWHMHYFVYHFHLCLFLALCTCLGHSSGKPKS